MSRLHMKYLVEFTPLESGLTQTRASIEVELSPGRLLFVGLDGCCHPTAAESERLAPEIRGLLALLESLRTGSGSPDAPAPLHGGHS